MGYKVTIVLIWLALPLVALLLLRADYARYQHEMDAQLKYAAIRKDMLLRYSMLYDNRGREVLSIADPQSRHQWERRLNEIEQQLEAQEQAVGNPGLSHYPLTRELIDDAQEQLLQQRNSLRDAGRLQDAFAKSHGNLDEMKMQVMALSFEADRARHFGAWDIFMFYQDQIAKLENQVNSRQRRRSELNNELTLALSKANSHRSELRRLLSGLPDMLALDQARTYREDLAQRFSNFNLRATVANIVTGARPAQAAQSR